MDFLAEYCSQLVNAMSKDKEKFKGDKEKTTLPFVCTVCSKSFSGNSSFLKHLRTHTGEKKFFCDICNKGYSRLSYLNAHLRIHSEEKPFACKKCPLTFIHKSHLIKHVRVHTGERPFVCSVCDKAFSRSAYLKTHVLTVHTGEKPFTCKVCNKSFSHHSSLKRHFPSHKDEKSFWCTLCHTKFSQDYSLRTHICVTGGEPFDLNSCNVQDSNSKAEVPAQLFECGICNAKFSEESNFKMHQYQCIPMDETPDENVKGYSQHLTPKRKSVFAEGKLFECTTCSVKFSKESSLKTHQCIPMDETPDQDAEGYSQHLSPKKKSVFAEGKVFECSTCSAKFSKESSLKTHQCTHVEETSAECSHESNYKTEVLVPTEENLLECCTCKAKFPEEYSLKTHECVCVEKDVRKALAPKQRANIVRINSPSGYSKVISPKRKLHPHPEKGGFECRTCHAKFSDKSSMKAHQCIHVEKTSGPRSFVVMKENMFECCNCHTKFNGKSDLKSHQCIDLENNSDLNGSCSKSFSPILTSTVKKHFAKRTVKKVRFSEECDLKTYQPIDVQEASDLNDCQSDCFQNFSSETKLPVFTENKKISENSSMKTHESSHLEKKFDPDVGCSQDFNPKTKLSHTEDKLLECSTCKERFSEESSFKTHQCIHVEKTSHLNASSSQDLKPKTKLLVHAEEKTFECCSCNTRFSEESNLKTHQCVHEEETSDLRAGCPQDSSTNAADYGNHRIVLKEEPVLECSTCKARFPEESSFITHQCIHVGEKSVGYSEDSSLKTEWPAFAEESLFVCVTCSTRFSDKSRLLTHQCIRVEGTSAAVCTPDFNLKIEPPVYAEEEMFECCLCYARLSESSLKTHECVDEDIEEIFSSDESEDYCPKTELVDLAGEKTEMQEEKVFECGLCYARLSESSLDTHQCIDEEENANLSSDFSDSDYSSPKPPLHMPSDEKPPLPVPSDYKPPFPIPSDDKPFACHVCNKGFYEISTLRTHLRVHTREKYFVCSICNINFSKDSVLREHLQIHMEE